MSEILHHKSSRGSRGTARSYRSDVRTIDFANGGVPPVVTFADRNSGRGRCLGCHDTPCIEKDASESALGKTLESFPGDPSSNVCPTDAITWDSRRQVVQVDSVACVGCGLCIVRCPYGALYLERGEKAAVLVEDSDRIQTTIGPKDSPTPHPVPLRKGTLGPSTSRALANLPTCLTNLANPAVFVRNVLHELSVKCRNRRRGDTNIRMDAVVATDDGDIGVVEIELTGAVLESPRALLEDVAILHTRYAMPITTICPISIVASLPNARSEYYQVIEDIHRVLGIRCRTLTVGSLALIMWNFGKIPGFRTDLFATTVGGADLLPSVRALVSSLSYAGEPYLAALQTAK